MTPVEINYNWKDTVHDAMSNGCYGLLARFIVKKLSANMNVSPLVLILCPIISEIGINTLGSKIELTPLHYGLIGVSSFQISFLLTRLFTHLTYRDAVVSILSALILKIIVSLAVMKLLPKNEPAGPKPKPNPPAVPS